MASRHHGAAVFAAVVLCGLMASCSCDEAQLSQQSSVAIQPDSIDFGTVEVGGSATRLLTIANEGRVLADVALMVPVGVTAVPAALTINPAESRVVELVFAPRAEMLITDSVVAASARSEVKVPLAGRAIDRRITALPMALDFEVIALGHSRELPLEIRSACSCSLEIGLEVTSGDRAPFFLGASQLQFEAPGALPVTVRFAPTQVGEFSAELSVIPCADCETTTVQLRGAAAIPQLRATPERLEFGSVSPGFTRELPLRLKNTGALGVTLSECTISGQSVESEYSIQPSGPLAAAVGETLDLAVRFAPTSVGSKQAELQCTDAEGAVVVSMPVTGRGGGPKLAISPSPIDFGLLPVGSASTREYSVTNVGEAMPVSILEIKFEGADAALFHIDSLALPQNVSVAPFVSSIRAESSALGDHRATLVVTSTDSDEPELRAEVIASAAEYDFCTVVAVPSLLDFGPVALGREHLRMLDLVNTGERPCRFWDLQVVPHRSPKFTLVNPPNGQVLVKPDGHFQVTVAYSSSEAAAQPEYGLLRYSYPAPIADGFVQLVAQAVEPGIEFQPESLDFGKIALQSRRRLKFVLRNVGATAVTLTRIELGAGSSGDMQLVVAPDASALSPGESAEGTVEFSPGHAGVQSGHLEVWTNELASPVRLPLRGEGTSSPCGGVDCEPPVVVCPGTQTVDAARPVTLAGIATDAAGNQASCEWSLTAAPPASRASLGASGPCEAILKPDVVGLYSVKLTAVGANGMVSDCQTQVHAQPTGGIWIEVSTDIASEWASGLAPILVDTTRAVGTFDLVGGNWACNPQCSYCCSTSWLDSCAWGAPGAEDDVVARGDWPGYAHLTDGPFLVEILQPVEGDQYLVGFCNHRIPGPPVTNMTINIYCAGSLLHSEVVTWRVPRAWNLPGTFGRVALGLVTRSPGSTCSWTAINAYYLN